MSLPPLFDATKTPKLMLGVWCAPPAAKDSAENDRRYAEMAEAGFNLAWNPSPAVLDACEKAGVKALVHLPTTRDTADNIEACLSFIEPIKDHPALLGFNITDEPSATWFPKLGRVRRAVEKRLSGGRYAVCNLYPDYASVEQLTGEPPEGADKKAWLAEHGVDYNTHVAEYMATLRPAMLSFDYYPLYEHRTDAEGFMHNMRVIADVAKAYNVPFHGFLQAISWIDHRVPTMAEYRWLAHCHFVHGAKLLSYFFYQAPYEDGGPEGFSSALVDFHGNKTPLYEQARALNAELFAMAPAFLAFDHRTFMTSGISKEQKAAMGLADAVSSFDGVTLSGEGQIVAGCFENGKLSGFYVLNFDFTAPAKATLSWEGNRHYEVWDKTGLDNRSEGTCVNLDLGPGEAAFVAVA
jgi:hypothetical protein